MNRKDQIKNAYKVTGNSASFYDGMITYSTIPGKAVCRVDGTLLTALETWLSRNPDKQIKVDKRITKRGPVFIASIELAPWTIQKEG